MRLGLKHVKLVLKRLEACAMPTAGIFFLASIYYGWLFTPQLVGDLATDKFSYDAPGVNYYLRLQWLFFLFGLYGIGGFFVLRAGWIFLENVRRNMAQFVVLMLLLASSLFLVYWTTERVYNRYYGSKVVSGAREQRSLKETAPSASQSPHIVLLAPDGSKAEPTRDSQARVEKKAELLAEMVKAFKDLNSYLLNWAILLLTSISAFLVRELNIVSRKEGG